jgi:hypothetical protein
VQGLVVHQHRNAEPRLLHRPLLGGVDVAGGLLGVAVDRAVVGAGGGVDHLGGLQALAVGRARDLAQAVGEVLAGLDRRELALGVWILALVSQMPISWAAFSSSVMRESRSRTRSSIGWVGSLYSGLLRLGGRRGGAGEGRGRGGQGGQADAERAAGDGLAHDLFRFPTMERTVGRTVAALLADVERQYGRQRSDHSSFLWYRSHFIA